MLIGFSMKPGRDVAAGDGLDRCHQDAEVRSTSNIDGLFRRAISKRIEPLV